MKKENVEIREALKAKKIPYWRFGEKLGVSDNTVQRRLRRELPPEVKKQYLEIIENMED